MRQVSVDEREGNWTGWRLKGGVKEKAGGLVVTTLASVATAGTVAYRTSL